MAALHLWRIFTRLRSRRGSSGFGGVDPISWPDIDAFIRRSRVSLAPWEVEIIEMLDDLFRTEQAKAKE